MIKENF